jgi:hypothetical protein
LAKLSREEQFRLLVYGPLGQGDAFEQLARQARALRGIAARLGAWASVSESYQAHLAEFRRRVAEVCTTDLVNGEPSVLVRWAAVMRRVNSELASWPADYETRFALLDEEKLGPVNLTQFSQRLLKCRGLRKDVRSLSRICRSLSMATRSRGRPRKSDN